MLEEVWNLFILKISSLLTCFWRMRYFLRMKHFPPQKKFKSILLIEVFCCDNLYALKYSFMLAQNALLEVIKIHKTTYRKL